MKFESKFNIDDQVWFMHENKPVAMYISVIEIFKTAAESNPIQYSGSKLSGLLGGYDYNGIPEDDLFPSKVTLLNSLFELPEE